MCRPTGKPFRTRVVETRAARTVPMTRSRRNLLSRVGGALAAVGGASVAGCLDFAAGDGPQGPEGTPATLSCADEGFVRLEAPFSEPVETQTVEANGTRIELSAEGTSETYGSSLRLVLRNNGDAAVATRGEHAYSIQRQTGTGGRRFAAHRPASPLSSLRRTGRSRPTEPIAGPSRWRRTRSRRRFPVRNSTSARRSGRAHTGSSTGDSSTPHRSVSSSNSSGEFAQRRIPTR